MNHASFVNDIFVDVLLAVVTHASKKEPSTDILVSGHVLGTHWSTIDVNQCEVARELSFVLGYQTPLRELFRLRTFNVEPTDLVATELKPMH